MRLLKEQLALAKHDSARCRILVAMIETENDDEKWPEYNKQLKVVVLRNLNGNKSMQDFYLGYLAQVYNNEGQYFTMLGEHRKAITCNEKSIPIQIKLKDSTNLAISYNNLGLSYKRLNEIKPAAENFEKSIAISRAQKNRANIAMTLNAQARLLQDIGDYPSAIEKLSESIKIQEEINDLRGLSFGLNNMGGIYQAMGDNKISIEYYNRALIVEKKINDVQGYAITLNNLASRLNVTGKREEARRLYWEVIRIMKNKNFFSGLSNSYLNLAHIHSEFKQFDSAFYYLDAAKNLGEELGDKEINFGYYYELSVLYFLKGDCSRAAVAAEKGYALAKELGWPEHLRKISHTAYRSFKQMNKQDKALKYYKEYILYRDSIASIQNKKAAIKSQLKYEFDKRAAADSVRASEEKKVTAAQLKQEKTQRFALYGSLGLVGVFALFMVNRFRVTNKQKKIIELQKQTVEEQKLMVEEKQQEILDSIKYARRIQEALITSEFSINRDLNRLKRN